MAIAIVMLVLWNLYHGHELVKSQQNVRFLYAEVAALQEELEGFYEDEPEETPVENQVAE